MAILLYLLSELYAGTEFSLETSWKGVYNVSKTGTVCFVYNFHFISSIATHSTPHTLFQKKYYNNSARTDSKIINNYCKLFYYNNHHMRF